MNPNKRTKTVLFVVDAAGKMIGEVLEGVNDAINEVTKEMRKPAFTIEDVDFRVNVLGFYGKTAKWMEPKPKKVAEFSCALDANPTDMERSAEEYDDAKFSVACDELVKKLSDTAFMGASDNALTPVVIMVVGHKLDNDDMKALGRLVDTKTKKAIIVSGGAEEVKSGNSVEILSKSFHDLLVLGPHCNAVSLRNAIVNQATLLAQALC